MAYSPIRTATDASQFAGEVVSYFSSSTYFSSAKAVANDDVQYGIVSEEGHHLCKLLKRGEAVPPCKRELIDSRLKEANLLMLRADEIVLKFLKTFMVCDWGNFEFMPDKRKVLDILNRQLGST